MNLINPSEGHPGAASFWQGDDGEKRLNFASQGSFAWTIPPVQPFPFLQHQGMGFAAKLFPFNPFQSP